MRFIPRGGRVFRWGHAKEALFKLEDFEQHLAQSGFALLQEKYVLGFGLHAAQKKQPRDASRAFEGHKHETV